MAQDNPLLGFFEGIGAGMEAGQRRRTLMERARQGEISPQDVPSLGMTALMGAVRAATPASTRLAQDQLRMQTANYALQNSIREKEYNLKYQNQILDNAELNAKLQQEINDNNGYRTAGEELQSLLNDGDIAAVRSYRAPEGMSLSGQQQIKKLKDELLAGEQAKRIAEYGDIKAQLMTTYSFTEENVPKDYWTAKQELETLAGMRESQLTVQKAEETMRMAEEVGAKSVTVQLGGGNQFTFNPTATETADAYTKPELSDKIISVRKNLADAQRYDSDNEEAMGTINNTLQMLENLAEAKGWIDIIPGYEPPTPPGPEPGPPAPVPESVAGFFPVPVIEKPVPRGAPIPKTGGSLYQRYLQIAD
jgi:hypothetical protein